MSTNPKATRENHGDFCTTEGWALVRGAAGKPVRHHRTYELVLDDGRILRTRIPRPVDRAAYRDSTWSHLLRDQLQADADEFWACVNDQVIPPRSRPAAPQRSSLPLHLVEGLIAHGLSPQEIATMSDDEAEARLHQLWSRRGQ